MIKLYTLLIVCTFLAWFYDHSYVHTLSGTTRKSRMIYFVLMAYLICFGGFRGQYNDTWTYRDAYVYTTFSFPEAWEYIPTKLGQSPSFELVNAFLKTYDVEVHLFLFFYFFWTTIFFMKFIKRYSDGLGLAVFFFISTGCYQFNMAAMKQVMATGICLAAFPLALKKDLKSKLVYIFFVFVAASFHPYALMYLSVFFLNFKPWSGRTYLLLGGILVGGFLFQPLLGAIVDITTAIGENYTTEALSGVGISVPRLLVAWMPVVLSFIYRKVLFEDCQPHEQVIMHLTMLFAGIQFVGIFGTALYFGRLSYYFSVMPCITLGWMLRKISRYNLKDGRFLSVCAVLGYILFLYFSNTLEGNFNESYAAISLKQFLNYLFTWLGGLGK